MNLLNWTCINIACIIIISAPFKVISEPIKYEDSISSPKFVSAQLSKESTLEKLKNLNYELQRLHKAVVEHSI